MKSAIVNIRIQFDLAIGNGTIEDVRRTLNEINEVLQQSFPFEQPQLFVGAVSDEDIEIANDENEDEDGGTMDGHIHPQEPIWSEIRDSFEDEGILHIDAWTSEDENDEDGHTIAKINMQTGAVEYLDERARTDKNAQNVIIENVHNIQKGLV